MSPRGRSAIVTLAMLAALAAAWLMRPRHEVPAGSVVLETMIPREFGAWKEEATSIVQVATELDRTTGAEIDRPVYDQVLMRTYRRDTDGTLIMLALAYGRQQRQELKIHRPELCYYGQGYDVTPVGERTIVFSRSVRVISQTLMTRNRARLEPVTYWIRIGDKISESAWQTRWNIFKDGLAGRIPDGILVRASSLIQSDSQSGQALEVQRRFLTDLYGSLSPWARRVITGV
jgi:EpsI family protein